MKTNNLFLLISMISIVLCNDHVLWDMGMVIKNEQSSSKKLIDQKTNNIQKEALISPTFIEPTKHSISTNFIKVNIFEPIVNSTNKERIIKKLNENYLNENYLNIIKMIDKSDITNLNINEQNNLKYLLADAYFKVGNYNNSIKIITDVLKQYPEDRFYILHGMILEYKGERKNAKKQYNKIITDYKKSEYYLTAKIKYQVLSRN
tara:strand:+ start:677 stop:1291 length:615 start_codon:yes stop_codon:yes gene_type:complete